MLFAALAKAAKQRPGGLKPFKGALYAHIEIVVTLIVVNLFSFFVIAPNAAGRFGPSLDT